MVRLLPAAVAILFSCSSCTGFGEEDDSAYIPLAINLSVDTIEERSPESDGWFLSPGEKVSVQGEVRYADGITDKTPIYPDSVTFHIFQGDRSIAIVTSTTAYFAVTLAASAFDYDESAFLICDPFPCGDPLRPRVTYYDSLTSVTDRFVVPVPDPKWVSSIQIHPLYPDAIVLPDCIPASGKQVEMKYAYGNASSEEFVQVGLWGEVDRCTWYVDDEKAGDACVLKHSFGVTGETTIALEAYHSPFTFSASATTDVVDFCD